MPKSTPILPAAVAATLSAQVAMATPALPGVARLLDVCTSDTLAEATTQGDGLGWPRQTDAARLEEWRSAFTRHNGGTVELVAWRRGPEERAGLLSFWIARGPNAHRACYLSSSDAPDLLEDLTRTLGRPDSLDRIEDIVSAAWTVGPTQVQFSRTGAATVLNIAQYDR